MAERTTGDRHRRVTVRVRGRVQGVGFRAWTRHRALEAGLTGSASNLADGSVEVVAEGPQAACLLLLDALRDGRAPGRVDGVEHAWSRSEGGFSGFVER